MEKYHLRRQEKQIVNDGELTEILEQGTYATIALCRDNEPYIVTLSYGFDASRHALYFHTGLVGLKIEFIKANPNVCATIIDDGGYMSGECNHRFRSLVIFGKMALVDDIDEKKHGLNVMLEQLEDDPALLLESLTQKENPYDHVAILRLDIDSLIGKSSLKKSEG
jgi:uncharacterized protein